MPRTLPPPRSFADRFILNLATLGPTGHLPKAPGTWGSLVAVGSAPVFFLPLPIWGRFLILVGLLILGAWSAGQAAIILGQKDPSCVVIDELWGQWTALFFVPRADLHWLLAAFVLFRLFDIVKPWPIRASESWLPRGWGIMLDDGLAGLYALIILSCAQLLAWP